MNNSLKKGKRTVLETYSHWKIIKNIQNKINYTLGPVSCQPKKSFGKADEISM